MTPTPIVTTASVMLFNVQSRRRNAPSMTQPSLMWQFVMSCVDVMRTLLPMVVTGRLCATMFSLTRRRTTSVNALSCSYFTIKQASWEFSPSKIMTLPSPTSLRTEITCPSPKEASGVVLMQPTSSMRQSSPMTQLRRVVRRMPLCLTKPWLISTVLLNEPSVTSP